MYTKIFKYFLFWRIGLFFVAFLSIFFLPVFGARFPYADRVLEITNLPYWVWGFGNFDGVHYLRIAQNGYEAMYSQAFFPLFPILIKFFAHLLPKDLTLNTALYTDPVYFYVGLILANLFFLASLFVLYKLFRLDFKKNISEFAIILLLVFPTAFYFGAVYTESLFLLLTASTLYLLRKERFFWSALAISLASTTKVFGVLLLIPYVVELWRKKDKSQLLWLMIAPFGLICYMYYLQIHFGDALYFLTSQPAFGAERTNNEIILLPQVLYRYMKIFLTTDIFTLPFFNALLELVFTIIPLTFLIMFVKKMRFSYWTFSVSTLLLGTLTGTLSSMPRYALIPMVLVLPYLIIRFKKYIKVVIVVCAVLAVLLTTLFIRGYWLA